MRRVHLAFHKDDSDGVAYVVMIRDVKIRKASSDHPPLFEVGYFDLERADETDYCRTTKYGTEPAMRALLVSVGVSSEEIDEYFEIANG
jgi:hypothetical protein